MRTKMFEYISDNGKVTITVRRGTVRDRLAVDAMVWDLPDVSSTAERHAQRSFAKLVQQSEVDGNLGFAWPSSSASAEAKSAAFDALMDADGTLWDLWNLNMLQVEGSIADPEIAEPPKKTDAVKLVSTKSA